ncbi:MAG: hypothetical protein AAB348_00925 [Patescibacteria group bacterium]
MKSILRLLEYLLFYFFILIIHISSLNFFPYPVNHINVPLVVVLWLMIVNSRFNVLLTGFVLAYASELLSGNLFGVGILSMMLSVIFIAWLMSNLLTNRTIYMVFLSTIISVIIYRLFFLALTFFTNFFRDLAVSFSVNIFVDIFWEIIFTTSVLVIIYLIGKKVIKNLNTGYVGRKKITF